MPCPFHRSPYKRGNSILVVARLKSADHANEYSSFVALVRQGAGRISANGHSCIPLCAAISFPVWPAGRPSLALAQAAPWPSFLCLECSVPAPLDLVRANVHLCRLPKVSWRFRLSRLL